MLFTRFFGGSITGGGSADNPVQVVYWGLWEPPVIMDELIAQFEAENPGIDIVYQQQTVKEYRERLQNNLAGGTGPDIFRFHLTWTPLLSSALTPIPDDVISAADFEAQQYPVVTSWLKSQKGYLGIPYMYEGLGLYYNHSVFEAAGKTPPKTWEELRQTALELTVKDKNGVIQRSGVALGTTSNVDNWSDIIGVLLLQNSANPIHPNTTLGQDALTFYTLFSQTDRVWDETMPTSTIAFATEKTVMMIAPSWRAHEVRSINPDLDFAIAPLPQLPNTNVSWASIWVDGVSSQSSKEKQAAAWKFLSFLNQKETLRSWYALASKQRLFGEIFARVDMADQLSSDPYVGSYLSQASTAKTWYLNSQTFDNGPNDKISKYYEDAINSMLEKSSSASQVLPTVEQGISQVMSQYQLSQ